MNDLLVPKWEKYGRLDQNPSVYFLLVAMLPCYTPFPISDDFPPHEGPTHSECKNEQNKSE